MLEIQKVIEEDIKSTQYRLNILKLREARRLKALQKEKLDEGLKKKRMVSLTNTRNELLVVEGVLINLKKALEEQKDV